MDENENTPARPDSLLPYDAWAEEALRAVVVRAIAFAAAEGLPGDHHFYISFRTDMPGVSVPPRLLAQYPHEITIVLQHQFWDLKVDEAAGAFSVGLSFGGIPTTLVVPLGAVTAFADPHVQFGLHFTPAEEPAANEGPPSGPLPGPSPSPSQGPGAAAPDAPAEAGAQAEAPPQPPQVVSLDAFRKRKE